MRSRLGGLRQSRHDQRMTRIDGYHRRAHPEPWHRGADQPRQRDRVIVELLRQPELTDADVVSAAGFGDRVVDDVDGLRMGKQHDSGRHTATNRRAEAAIPIYFGLIGSLASQHSIAQPLVCRVDHCLAGSLDEEVRDERIGFDGDVDRHDGRRAGVVRSQRVLVVLGVLLLLRALRIPHQPIGAQRNSRTSSSSRPERLTARRTWCGRPSSYLPRTSARLYAGAYDSRASTSASASMMASGGASITSLRDVRTATTRTYDAYFSMTRLRRLSVATSSTIFLPRLIRNSGIGAARSAAPRPGRAGYGRTAVPVRPGRRRWLSPALSAP